MMSESGRRLNQMAWRDELVLHRFDTIKKEMSGTAAITAGSLMFAPGFTSIVTQLSFSDSAETGAQYRR